ncbi:MAG: phosphatidylglycerophosphatase A [bacterium]|nr:phosphatidylglycerophosphatase A [bacterium]
MRRLAVAVATCLGAGYAPVAPGTAGAAVGLLVAIACSPWPLLYGLVAAALFFGGAAAGTAAEASFGRKDSPRIVIDEAASMLVTFAGLPLGPAVLAAGFALNRIFDIVKPPPARALQELRGGWGIMLDDLVAGIYSNIVLRIGLALFTR